MSNQPRETALQKVDRFANGLLATVFKKLREILTANWLDIGRSDLGCLGFFVGLPALGCFLIYQFTWDQADLNILQAVIGMIGLVLASPGVLFLGLASWGILAGAAMLVAGLLLKLLVMLGSI